MTVQRETPQPGWVPPAPTRWQRIPGAVKGLGILVVLAAIVAGILSLTGGNGDHKSPTPAKASDEAAADKAGVVFSSIATNSGGSDKLLGYSIGFPHTETGAIEAAFSYTAATASPAAFSDSKGPQLWAYMSPKWPWTEWLNGTVLATRKAQSLNAEAQVIDAEGNVDPNKEFVAEVLQRYGVFRVTESSADHVTVEMWAPAMIGVLDNTATDQPGVRYVITSGTMPMYWSEGDWRYDADASKAGPQVELPGGLPAVSFAFRAEHFPASEGWKAPADATQSLRLPHGIKQVHR